MRTSPRGFATAIGLVSLARVPFSRATASPSPLAVPPSESWVGDDGSWSTFSIHVGTPEQSLNVLVSTAFPNSALVLDEACSDDATGSCATSRGGIFSPNSSSTWQGRGIYELFPELNYTTSQDRGQFGLDTIGLGLGSAGPNLDGQVIAALETTDYYIGMLGIDPQPTNWTLNFTEQSPSFFKTLYTQNLIPSLTYSYTAGAAYRFKKVLGSLVFGGYDASRVQPNDMTFTMADDVTGDLLVAIQSIESSTVTGDSRELLAGGGVFALIDSSTPYFVLPLEACQQFEAAFGLVWDPTAGHDGLYTLSQIQHEALLAASPTFTFSLSDSISGGSSVAITLPYSAFDLTASYPLVKNQTQYFPLLRASNTSQITLGRAFLQETMLIADYEQGNFSVYQCVWNENAQQNLVPILSQNSTGSANSTGGVPVSSTNESLTIGVGVGVGVGAGIPLLLTAFLFFARRKRIWPFHNQRPPVPPKEPQGRELDSTLLTVAGTASARTSAMKDSVYTNGADDKDPEVMGYYHRPELDGSVENFRGTPELPGSRGTPRPEFANEVEGSIVYPELPGSGVPPAYMPSAGSSLRGFSEYDYSGLESPMYTISRRSSNGTAIASHKGSVSTAQPSRSSRGPR